MPEQLTGNQLARKFYEDHIGLWDSYRVAMDKEEEFLDGDRYENDEGSYNRDRRLTKIRGQETQDTIRHVVAKVTERAMSLEARPIDKDDDPDAAELAVSLVEHELTNPWKGFEDCYEAAVISAREKRLGVVWMDWDPDVGPWGEILYSYVDPRRVMWDPAYDPHHPKCSFVLVEKRLDPKWVNKTYKIDWVTPDSAAFTSGGRIRSDLPILKGANGERLPGQQSFYRDGKATIWYLWLKNDETMHAEPRVKDFEPFEDDGERFLSCKSCGFRSDTQESLNDDEEELARLGFSPAEDGTLELPEMMERGCPTCSGDLERIDGHAVNEFVRAYEKGKRLIVMAPFSVSPDDKPIYDKGWPIRSARSFPGMFLTAYVKPGRPMGPSDTTLMWDQQVASDNLRTMALQRVFEHRNYWVLPRNGIYDYRGGRFAFREDQFNIMYRDASVMGPLDIQLLNGTGLDPGWQVAFGAVQTALTQYRGVTDLGISQETSKNIAASTVAQLNQLGEIPTAHFNRRKNRERGKFAGVVWDYIRATYTPERLSRLNIDGTEILARLSGDDLPNFDFVIEDTPDFTGLEKARSEAFTALMQTALNPQTAPFLDIFAELNNLPRSVVRKIEKRMQEAQAMAPTVGGGMVPGPESGMGLDEALAGAGLEAGPPLNGAGMVPAL